MASAESPGSQPVALAANLTKKVGQPAASSLLESFLHLLSPSFLHLLSPSSFPSQASSSLCFLCLSSTNILLTDNGLILSKTKDATHITLEKTKNLTVEEEEE